MSDRLQTYHFYKPFATTLAGFLVPMITGLVSATSSGLILYVIFKSDIKLSSTYHRIMALMSCFDIISSIFIALGTIMMPSDNIFKFAGPMLGNKSTCQMQGWLVVFGLAGSTSSFTCLSLYFVLNIAFKVDGMKLKTCIEPVMHLLSMVIAIFVPSFFLLRDLLNPNAYDSFCTIVPYPLSCDETEWYDWNNCTWREGVLDRYFTIGMLPIFFSGSQYIFVVVCMMIILRVVHSTNTSKVKWSDDESNQKASKGEVASDAESGNIAMNADVETKYTRVITTQVLMYIGAYFLTWILVLLSAAFNVANYTLDAINSVFFPLQGFWNLIIFLYDKSYLIQQTNNAMTSWQVFQVILKSPSNIPAVVLVNISSALDDHVRTDRIVHPPKMPEEESEVQAQVSVYRAVEELSSSSEAKPQSMFRSVTVDQ